MEIAYVICSQNSRQILCHHQHTPILPRPALYHLSHKLSLTSIFLKIFFKIFIVLGVHYDVSQSSYKISQLTPPFTIILYCSHPHSWNSFDRSHFSIFIHEHIIFPLYSPSYTFCLQPPPTPALVPTPRQELFYIPILCFWKKDIFVCIR
jgi:hypothetical protein